MRTASIFRRLLSSGLALGLVAFMGAGQAAVLTESAALEFSNDRLAPTLFTLDLANGGSNTLSGRIGRQAGVVDRDYLHLVVPTGSVLRALIVGSSTAVGGNGSFIGLASGSTVQVPDSAANAAGLLGWRVYGVGDCGTDILDDMATAGNGSLGFAVPLQAGSYALWIQELSTGDFNYSFNLALAAVPEPTSALLVLLALGGAPAASRRQRS